MRSYIRTLVVPAHFRGPYSREKRQLHAEKKKDQISGKLLKLHKIDHERARCGLSRKEDESSSGAHEMRNSLFLSLSRGTCPADVFLIRQKRTRCREDTAAYRFISLTYRALKSVFFFFAKNFNLEHISFSAIFFSCI